MRHVLALSMSLLLAVPAAAQTVAVVAPTLNAAPGSTVDLPITCLPGAGGLGIVAAQVRMELGASIIQSSSFVTGEGWIWTWGAPARNATAAFAVAAAAGTTPVPAGSDVLATLRVVIRADAPIGADLPLTLSVAQLNEGAPAVEVSHGVLRIRTGTVGVGADPHARLALAAPAPHPARESVRFGVRVADAGQPVRLAILGLDGRHVRLLEEGVLSAGEHERRWDLRDDRGRLAPPGLYLAVLQSAGERHVRRVLIMR